MSEIGDTFKVLKVVHQEKRAANRSSSAQILTDAGIRFEVKNGGAHLIVHGARGVIDFWPGTGKYICRFGSVTTPKIIGRGVRNVVSLAS